MRILLMHHQPLAQPGPGRLARGWAQALEEAGHEVRLLVIDQQCAGGERLSIERVVCRAGDSTADLPFAIPRFSTSVDGELSRLTFLELTDAQLAMYRERLRRSLDALVERFDPHVIHAQHIWVLGQLALETGVPYVLSAWEDELVDYQRDARYRALADQAAENAGRILVPSGSLFERVGRLFESAAERASVMPAEIVLDEARSAAASRAAGAARLVAIYRAVVAERFGKHP